jgi:hypothetical protein
MSFTTRSDDPRAPAIQPGNPAHVFSGKVERAVGFADDAENFSLLFGRLVPAKRAVVVFGVFPGDGEGLRSDGVMS